MDDGLLVCSFLPMRTGITYGALSASWDPTREGSLLGWTEFRANLPLFLSRGKTN